MKKQILAAALLGFSISSVQAVELPLTFDDVYSEDYQILSYEFENLSTNNVSIWMDTKVDGFDARGSLFVQDSTSWNWVSEVFNASESDYDEALGYNTSGKNDFGVDLKNGYVSKDPNNRGISDPGETFANLSAGKYLFVVTHEGHASIAGKDGGGTLDDGFEDLRLSPVPFVAANAPAWSKDPYYTGSPSEFRVFIEGDVSNVSAVPVPAAVWLFATALTGLGFSQRKKVG